MFSPGQLAFTCTVSITDILIELPGEDALHLRKRLPVRCRPPLPEFPLRRTDSPDRQIRASSRGRSPRRCRRNSPHLRSGSKNGAAESPGRQSHSSMVIVSVHGGVSSPTSSVNGFPMVVKLALELERACTHEVCNERSPVDRESAVILPLVGYPILI